ncbi:hypothetical protein NUW54_g13823 [Trametes sanguinea]|uniref:Uncharacterized protein n=1 Tax=Trametes sanguinea TaxID=158606 RepID=A0ACC1MJE3_9APHY|nr:hypothetical protein NUW54_g13823 [Trametes sanguinea]
MVYSMRAFKCLAASQKATAASRQRTVPRDTHPRPGDIAISVQSPPLPTYPAFSRDNAELADQWRTSVAYGLCSRLGVPK